MSKDKETAREFASSAGDTMTGTTRSFSMDTEESYAEFRDGDIHVMRLGPLFDIESGEKILDLDPELAQTIATTTQAVIESGHTVPMSLEHGIETGYRGNPGATADHTDRSPAFITFMKMMKAESPQAYTHRKSGPLSVRSSLRLRRCRMAGPLSVYLPGSSSPRHTTRGAGRSLGRLGLTFSR